MTFAIDLSRWPRPRKGNANEMGTDVPNIFKAAATDDVEGIDAALAVGVDVNSVDDDNMTPLHYAAGHLASRSVDRLLKELRSPNPINPTLIDRFGRSASSIALEVWGALGIEMADKLRPYCYPSNPPNENDALS